MKILAYGGNQHSIRASIGDWPEVPISSLADSYGIPPESPSFGVVFPADTPCLVYRERMNLALRSGGYPFTILLDLGSANRGNAFWSGADFNAAALLYFLFRAESPWRAALLNPETLSPALLESMLAEMLRQRLPDAFRNKARGAEDPGRWACLLTGSLVVGPLTVATPASLGLAARPTLKEVAEWTAQMPLPSRIGRGWMVGGSSTQASGFGAAVLVDDQAYGEHADPGVVIENGARMLGLLSELSRRHSGQQEEAWGDALTGQSPAGFFERVLLWDRVQKGEEEAYRKPLPPDGALAIEILEAALTSAEKSARRGERIGLHRSRALLEVAEAGAGTLTEDVVRHLDAAVLRKWLDAQRIPPEAVGSHLSLPPEILLERCLDRIRAEGLTPETLERYRNYLRVNNAGEMEDSLLGKVAPQLSSPLMGWMRGDDRKLLKWLQAEAEARFLERKGRSRLGDALEFLGAEWVARQVAASPEDLGPSVENLLQEKPLSEPAEEFLESLASSPARTTLGAVLKTEIAGRVHGSWEELWQLSEWLQGRGQFAAGRMKEDKEILAGECLELIEDYARRNVLNVSKADFAGIAKKLRLRERYGVRLQALAERYAQFRRVYTSSANERETDQPSLFVSKASGRKDPRETAAKGGRARRSMEEIDEGARLPAARDLGIARRREEIADPDAARVDAHRASMEAAERQGLPEAVSEATRVQELITELADAVRRGQVVFPSSESLGRKADWDDLVDVLCFRKLSRVRGKPRKPQDYGPPQNYLPVWTAGGLLGAAVVAAVLYAAGTLQGTFHGVSPAVFIAGLVVASAITFVVSRVVTDRYVLNIPGEQYDRLISLLDHLFASKNPYAISRERSLVRNLALSDQPVRQLGSFDRALLLYVGSDPDRVRNFAAAKPELIGRIRRNLYRTLLGEHMIRRKGWVQ